jgi:hypothetical protein
MNTRRLVHPDLGESGTGTSRPNSTGRSIPYSIGKVLGGRPSINVMIWARK